MYKSSLIHLPLQFFAEGGDGAASNAADGGTGGTAPADGNTAGQQTAAPTFDDMLKDKGFQAEFDRRMAKAQETALTNARGEWEKQAQAEKEEAARVKGKTYT